MAKMTEDQEQAIQSGAQRVDEREHMSAGLESPRDVTVEEREPEAGLPGGPVKTEMGAMQLSMFAQGTQVRVRVGDAHNGSEMFEGVYGSAEEANAALIEAGVLTAGQVEDSTEVAGTGVELQGVTVEQLEAAGLKRHGVATL